MQQSQSFSQQQRPAATSAAVATADIGEKSATEAAVAMQQLSNDCNNPLLATSSKNDSIPKHTKDIDPNETFSLANVLRKTFLQKYPRSFIFYSQCVDFFKQVSINFIKVGQL